MLWCFAVSFAFFRLHGLLLFWIWTDWILGCYMSISLKIFFYDVGSRQVEGVSVEGDRILICSVP